MERRLLRLLEPVRPALNELVVRQRLRIGQSRHVVRQRTAARMASQAFRSCGTGSDVVCDAINRDWASWAAWTDPSIARVSLTARYPGSSMEDSCRRHREGALKKIACRAEHEFDF